MSYYVQRGENMSQNPKVDFLKGNFYEKIGKSELAVEKFVEAAEAGYEKAQWILGQLYDSVGEIEKAENWYKLAFNSGIDYAAFNLGNKIGRASCRERV